MTTLIQIEDLSVGYSPDNVILKNINLTVKKGDYIGIIGPNGGGKTTLLRAILGLLTPQSGHIHYHFTGNRSAKAQMGYMPQQRQIDPNFPITVRDLILGGFCEASQVGKRLCSEQKRQATKLMEQLGILPIQNQCIGELSGGQQQRTFLARALVNSPTVLLLDEPDTFVDSGFVQSFYDLLDQLNRELTILLVSHDLGMIAPHIKSVACINGDLHFHDNGEITQEILDSYACPIQLISHGPVAHRVLRDHDQVKDIQSP